MGRIQEFVQGGLNFILCGGGEGSAFVRAQNQMEIIAFTDQGGWGGAEPPEYVSVPICSQFEQNVHNFEMTLVSSILRNLSNIDQCI